MACFGVERRFQPALQVQIPYLAKYDLYGVNTESLTVNTKPTQPVWATHDPKLPQRRVGSDADRFERLYSRSHEAVCAR